MAHNNMDQNMRADRKLSNRETIPPQGRKRKTIDQPTNYQYRGPPDYLMASILKITMPATNSFCCPRPQQYMREEKC